MFQGLTAWFSSSVEAGKKKLWTDNDGIEVLLEDAQFVFSEDAEAADTLRVFESESYLEEHLSVFHPNYITECVKKGTMQHVVLGKYFLPPKEVQELARKQMQHCWDYSINTSVRNTDSPSKREQQDGRVDQAVVAGPSGTSSTPVQNINKKEPEKLPLKTSQKSAGTDASPVKKTRNDSKRHLEQSPTTNNLNVQQMKPSPDRSQNISKNKLAQPERSTEGRITQKSDQFKHSGQTGTKKPNDMETSCEIKGSRKTDQFDTIEILRLEDMAKVTGELEDFIAGKNGCEIIVQ